MNSEQRAALEKYNYYNDPRTIAAMTTSAYKVKTCGPHRALIELDELLLENLIDDGLLPEGHHGILEMRTKAEVCGLCKGSGKVVDPRYDAGGLTQEDIDQDPQWFYDSYMAGDCDVTCPECGGLRVVYLPEFEDAKLHRAVSRWMEDAYEDARTRARELAMGY